MLKISCIHPELIAALSLCGHGDKVLISDGNYPLDSRSGGAKKIYLGLCPGVPEVTQVLSAMLGAVAVEKAEVMLPEDESTPSIFGEFQTLLGGMELHGLSRQGFYDAASQPTVRLAVSTGEKRIFANLLLTIGVA